MTTSRIPMKNATYALLNLWPELALYTAALLSLAAGMAHLWVMPEHFAEWWGYGAFFLAVAAAPGVYGAILLRWPTRTVSVSGIYLNLSLVAFYVITRTAGILFFGPHAGAVHAVGTVDLVCVAAESALIYPLVARAGVFSSARLYAVLGAVQALSVGAVLHLLPSGMHETHGLDLVSHWLQNSTLAIPISILSLL